MTTEFRTFFRDNYDDVVGNLRRSGATDDTAADCTQEAFVRAYARWWRVGHYREPAAWVQRVATNLMRDVQRGRVRFERAVTLLAATNVETAPAASDAADTSIRFDRAVSTLPPQQQRAVDAYYGDGLDTEQGAEQLGISSGAFRFHLHQARNNLRPLLSAGDTGGED